MADDSPFGPHLLVRPAQLVFDRLVVVLARLAQPLDLIHLLGADLRQGKEVAKYQVDSGLSCRGSRVAVIRRTLLVGPELVPSSSSTMERTSALPRLAKRTVRCHDISRGCTRRVIG